jgi:hypothetical protein
MSIDLPDSIATFFQMSNGSAEAFTVEPLRVAQQGSSVRVRARVSGNFPGSPVELEHVFRLGGGKIESLEIH